MPSTYSSNLKLELMATGENSGTWGNITNTNLGTAAEQAIVGYGSVVYASDANLTISITNSNAAQAARALVLNVTSSVSLTGTRELVVPTIEKQYIVQNNTTGSQSITVKTSAGTGITVPNGRKAHLYVDGTNVIQMFDFVDINGGTIDGTTVGASSASTGAFTTLNASGATTLDGSVALGNASGDLITVPGTINSHLLFTDNTYDIGASGATRPRNLFLAGAATIGGNLSVGGTLTLTGGLILNGNVTVGDSSADTLTVNATITSNLLFTDNTYDIGASGATRPRNLFLAGNATIGGNTTMTGSLTVDSTTDSSSTTTGSIQTDGGLGVAKALYVGTTANIAGNVTLSGGTANGVTYLNGSKVLTTGSALTFDGTTFATTARTSATNGAWVGSGAVVGWGAAGTFSNYIVADTASNYMLFQVASAEGMRLTSTGLGIGTSSPAEKLDVNGNIQQRNGSGVTIGKIENASGWYSLTGDSANVNGAQMSHSTTLRFVTASTERARITSGGNLLVGTTTTPTGFSNRIITSVISASAANPSVVTYANGSATSYHGIGTSNNQFDIVALGTNNSIVFYNGSDGTTPTERVRISPTGLVGIGTGSPATALQINAAAPTIRLQESTTGGDKRLELGVTSGGLAFIGANQSAQDLTFQTVGSERMRITSTGNVGVGTASPNYLIDSQTTSTSITTNLKVNASAASGNYGEIAFQLWSGAGSGLNTFGGSGTSRPSVVLRGLSEDSNATGAFVVATFGGGSTNATLTEKMRVTSAGNLGVGTTTPAQRIVAVSSDGLISIGPSGWRDTARATILQRTLTNNPAEIDFQNTNGGLNYGWQISSREGTSPTLDFYSNSNSTYLLRGRFEFGGGFVVGASNSVNSAVITARNMGMSSYIGTNNGTLNTIVSGTGSGGGLVLISGVSFGSGQSFSRLYLAGVKVSGGAASVFTTAISSVGEAGASFAFADSGGFVTVTASGLPNATWTVMWINC
jgi:hypothetical protein